MVVAERVHRLDVTADDVGIGRDLALWERDADLHVDARARSFIARRPDAAMSRSASRCWSSVTLRVGSPRTTRMSARLPRSSVPVPSLMAQASAARLVPARGASTGCIPVWHRYSSSLALSS